MNFPWWKRLARGARARLSFPLLTKELLETSAQRRTYILRVIYAVALYAVFVLLLPRETWTSVRQSSFELLGSGRQMFETLVILQYFGTALFMPALMCGRITQEKERDSLVLLFLTELRPWSIVLQKYLGGLVLMLSFFLLGLPLAGVAYAFGGLETGEVGRYLLGLFVTCLQLGALSLFCSAWCRSTVGSFIGTYLFGTIFYAAPPLSIILLSMGARGYSRSDAMEYCAGMFIPPAALQMSTIMGTRSGGSIDPAWPVYLLPSIASIFLFLVLARWFLVRRALVPPVNFLRPFFERLDRLMKRMNRATGGIVLWRESSNLPADEPIFWRETHRRVLGKPHYLLRLLCAVQIPTVFACLAIALMQSFSSYGRDWREYSWLLGSLGALVALFISAHAANTIVAERVGQSLEVLLTTPLSARDIVRQKERALRRLLIVVAVPLLTIVAAKAYARFDIPAPQSHDSWMSYLVCATLMICINLPLVTWLSLWISIRVRTRFHAILGAVGALALWVGLAPLTFYLTDHDTFGAAPIWRMLVLISPVSVAYLNEFSQLEQILWPITNPWPAILLNTILYASIALLIRWRLFADSESLLRR